MMVSASASSRRMQILSTNICTPDSIRVRLRGVLVGSSYSSCQGTAQENLSESCTDQGFVVFCRFTEPRRRF